MNTSITQITLSFLSLKYRAPNFFHSPMFLQESSVFIHLVLLFGLMFSWVCKMLRSRPNERPKDRNFWYHTLVLFSSLSLSLYNLVFFCLNYFYWDIGENLATILDSALQVVAWFFVFVYLHARLKHSSGLQFPLLLRIWWGCYLAVSCYCLAIHIAQCREDQCSQTQVFVSDSVYVISGIFFSCAGIFGKFIKENTILQEPLLNGNDSIDSNRSVGSETVSPYSNAGCFSILTFSWVSPLISKGYKKTLELEDVPSLPNEDDVNKSYMTFRNYLDFARDGSVDKVTTMQLVKSLIATSWADILLTAFYCLLCTLTSFIGPYLMDTFVQYLNGKRETNEGYVLVSTFFIAKFVECLALRHWFFRLQVVGIRAKTVLMGSIYSKVLSLSCTSKQGHTSGEMINFMSIDADRVGQFCWYMHDPWTVILQVVLALLILYKNLGLASIAAFVATVLIMLVNYPVSSLLGKYQEKLMESKDKRMKATTEMLKNMRILKLQAWEMKFLSKIVELRNTENGWLKNFLYTTAMTTFLFWSAPTFLSVVTYLTCAIMGTPLESGKILFALATFWILQEPIYTLPDVISTMIQTKVSLDRIASFLCLEDLEPDSVERLPRATSKLAVEISGGNFTWDPPALIPTLKDINLRVHHGTKVAICGAVGSGKSTLLSCILGEVPKISGILRLSGSKAYVSQSSWIQSGTIVDNVLFGLEMDSIRYERVLEACSLKKDLEILALGDQTIIGERGINLSGGQKQRIQIARALYQDADIYIFDDPFSAVDAHTGSHLFKECLLGLLETKTVIYVTHQLEFLPAADLILVMKEGRIMQAGKYRDILDIGKDFVELVGAHEHALSMLQSIGCEAANAVDEERNHKEASDNKSENADDMTGLNGQLVEEEEREKGRVGLSVYWKYMTTAYGGALLPFILLSQVLLQILQIGSNYWLAWATPVSSDTDEPTVDGSTLILVYVALSVGSAFCVLARAILLVTAGYKTATLLFSKMYDCMFRAPMSFFDATPSGRILNRASTDQSAVDMKIPYQIDSSAVSVIQLLGIIVVMSQGTWQVLVIYIPVITICLWCQQYYLPSARELSRLIGVTKAPVIQHFAETISGAVTIRSFNQQARFHETSMNLIDNYLRPIFYNSVVMQWLCFRLDMLSLVAFACCLIFLISIPVGSIDPGIAGLAVTYGLSLNHILGWVIWHLCNMENTIISVERILQYTCLQSEPPLVIEGNRPDKLWPSNGQVDIQNLQVRYAPHMPLVLRGITCTFVGERKTGIVGRTGSGKSTLIQALFRIVEAASGQINIDGIDISSIGLHDLRSRLSIIPQDPTMFEGTVRSNLDPLEEHTDEQIWEALDKCQLGDEVRKKEGKLDSTVTENGENWSMGQRQLVCLGRVLLKRSKILVLDEATASVDTATDNLIQQTLRDHFSDSTVIVVAHRITSVIDSDVVVLLSNGLVEECDSPMRLLEDKSSSFAKLVAEHTTDQNPARLQCWKNHTVTYKLR